jgi:hypothetical protein
MRTLSTTASGRSSQKSLDLGANVDLPIEIVSEVSLAEMIYPQQRVFGGGTDQVEVARSPQPSRAVATLAHRPDLRRDSAHVFRLSIHCGRQPLAQRRNGECRNT